MISFEAEGSQVLAGKKALYQRKAAYFNQQVKEAWAAQEYSEQEKEKLEMIFTEAGSLKKMKILEPGCGTGRLTEILSDRVGSSGHIVALDISPKMVAAAGERLAGRKNVQIHLAAIETFRFTDNSFDMVICHQVFPHFEDKARVLAVMRRVLKRGGKLIVHHLISLQEMNDLHRKSGTPIQHDIMPASEEIKALFGKFGFKVAFICDGEDGYFLNAVKSDKIPGKLKA